MYTNDEILRYIKQYVDKQYLDISDIVITKSNNKTDPNLYSVIIKSSPTTWRPDSSEKSFAKIKFGKTMQYIAFNENCISLFNELSIPYTKVKSENMLRIALDEFFIIEPEKLNKLFNQIFIKAFNIASFGCCGKYKECQEKGCCVHGDIIYANACQYRKIIVQKK